MSSLCRPCAKVTQTRRKVSCSRACLWTGEQSFCVILYAWVRPFDVVADGFCGSTDDKRADFESQGHLHSIVNSESLAALGTRYVWDLFGII